MKPCILTLMDVLGSSELFMSDNDAEKERYLRNLQNMFLTAGKYYPSDQIKTFSDNILIHDSDDDSRLSKMVNSIAQMQYQSVCNLGLMIRGAIASGGLYRSNNELDFDDFTIGDGLVSAYRLESEIANYPMIVVQQQLSERFLNGDGDDALLIKQGNFYYVDYLQVTITDEFPDESKIMAHRKALINHVLKNNNKKDVGKWDRVRAKDVWCLSYHNQFCARNEVEEYEINFTEAINEERARIEIKIKESD